MRRRSIDLWSPAIGASGTVVAYGHWGRPVLVFPAEAGRAGDFEAHGMVDAVADLIHDGKVGKVSLVGAGMRNHPGVTATFCEALSAVGVNIETIRFYERIGDHAVSLVRRVGFLVTGDSLDTLSEGVDVQEF